MAVGAANHNALPIASNSSHSVRISVSTNQPKINNSLVDEAYAVRGQLKSGGFGYVHRAGQLVTRIADAQLYQQRQLAETAGKAARKTGNPNIEPDSYQTVLVKVIEGSAVPIPD